MTQEWTPPREFPMRLAPLIRQLRWLGSAGAAALLFGLWLAPERTWRDILMGGFAMVCLGLAGIFFVALQYASGAVWSIVLRRVGEAMTPAIYVGGIGVLLVLFAHPSTYPWYGHVIVAEGWAGFKQGWLSYLFFVARSITYLALWLGFAWAIENNSRKQDEETNAGLTGRNIRLSAAFLIVFGITFWLASTDWVMTLEPSWASTIFGVYNFAGMFSAGLAVIALLTIALRETGPLREAATDDHLLDLGRLILAFTTFWGYIWFSQYMLIWYANLSEETPYMVLRTNFGWGRLFVLNLLLNWALPFLLLLPRVNKKTSRTLAAAAILVLLGRATDLYLMIIPPLSPNNPLPQLWDVAAIALVVSSFLIITLRKFFRAAPVPIGDPLLSESLGGHG